MSTVIESISSLQIQHDNRVGLDDLERDIQRSLRSLPERKAEERNRVAIPTEVNLSEPSRVGLDELAKAIRAARDGQY